MPRIRSDCCATLQHAFPRDIVMNDILPFLELPPYTFFGVEDDGMEEDDIVIPVSQMMKMKVATMR